MTDKTPKKLPPLTPRSTAVPPWGATAAAVVAPSTSSAPAVQPPQHGAGGLAITNIEFHGVVDRAVPAMPFTGISPGNVGRQLQLHMQPGLVTQRHQQGKERNEKKHDKQAGEADVVRELRFDCY